MNHSLRAILGGVVLLTATGCGSPVSSSARPYAAQPRGSASPLAPPLPAAPLTAPPAPVVAASRSSTLRSAKPPPRATARSTPARPAPTARATRPVGLHYVFPVTGCAVGYGRSHHDYPATDIFAAAGCSVVAPVAGRVDEVAYADRWNPSTNRGADRGGVSVSVVGADGVRYYGSHLSSVAGGVRPGLRVRAGQLLGRVGSTGSARGLAPHLHFGISWPTPAGVWWVRRGEVYPWPYLDSWRSGGSSSPAAAVLTLRARLGVVPPCTSYC